ncbi:uncharacterized protein LOC107216735 [Neodiprion lecontei]|uniref:Uncharacterized protein LOC107216735 n=1 Tax=Neodiprion lecontei TaxID=441921 RepID=A0A6J0B344_NEOLC|nr:uncharacterized protein LOC107216735 [Neodiprion lecontei]XP_046592137.1 uncharacterized protein LOC107216735 [Neodiprion lecontei]
MKGPTVAVTILAFAVTCLAVPRNKRQAFDEPRISNEVIPGSIEVVDETSQVLITTPVTNPAPVETTKYPELDDAPTVKPGNKKKPNSASRPASDTFSRVIDDIFNIPISVLRAVNTLLSNAFGTKQGTPTAPTAAEPSPTAA